jgi:hypothetical protein
LVTVEEELLDEVVLVDGGWACVVCAVPEGRCALEPHPAANITTAIAVSPAGRIG